MLPVESSTSYMSKKKPRGRMEVTGGRPGKEAGGRIQQGE
jgi:hypothetical protein